jgi:hypothetical protein
MTALWIAVSVAGAAALWMLFWVAITFLVGRSARQREFVRGRVPTSAPEGFYQGTAHLLGGGSVPWLGKTFVPKENVGLNTFTPRGASLLQLLTPFYRVFRTNADGNTDAYYFKTSVSPGFRDKQIETFKLDYDSPENPFLIRIILDEMSKRPRTNFSVRCT